MSSRLALRNEQLGFNASSSRSSYPFQEDKLFLSTRTEKGRAGRTSTTWMLKSHNNLVNSKLWRGVLGRIMNPEFRKRASPPVK